MAKRYLIIVVPLCVVTLVAGSLTVNHVIKRLRERDLASRLIRRPDTTITVVEGKRREEIASLLDTAGVTSYQDFMEASNDYEGYLFPDTYRFYPDTPASTVVQTMVHNFNKRLSATGIQLQKEQLILASIVEREASNDSERPLIAGVYMNRITKGMKLEADPTVQYGKDTEGNPRLYWGTITRADYQDVMSPYNTYRVTGLPPGPIANPGLKSITAAVNPAQHDYLYFVHRKGKLILSRTLEEHEQAIANADQEG